MLSLVKEKTTLSKRKDNPVNIAFTCTQSEKVWKYFGSYVGNLSLHFLLLIILYVLFFPLVKSVSLAISVTHAKE
jgi:hypothetical protein